MPSFTATSSILLAIALAAAPSFAQSRCEARSGPQRLPVLELYTSEGCSSCPPADRWLSGLKQAAAEGRVLAQAFHVGYWDRLGWVDRFASPAHTTRQRQVASWNDTATIYTPQLVHNGRDSRDYARALASPAEAAQAAIRLTRAADGALEADVTPAAARPWSAYWTVTEHGHRSKVSAGENAGETLQHDFVVRQYVPAGRYEGTQTLRFHPVAATAGHARQVNLVVFDPTSGRPLQALSLAC